VTRECCAELGPRRSPKYRTGTERRRHRARFRLADLLRVLVRNLLDNAIRYTPEGGHIGVAIRSLKIQRINSKSAIAAPAFRTSNSPSLGQRFRRFNPTQAEGVGWDYPSSLRIAEIHQARIAFPVPQRWRTQMNANFRRFPLITCDSDRPVSRTTICS